MSRYRPSVRFNAIQFWPEDDLRFVAAIPGVSRKSGPPGTPIGECPHYFDQAGMAVSISPGDWIVTRIGSGVSPFVVRDEEFAAAYEPDYGACVPASHHEDDGA